MPAIIQTTVQCPRCGTPFQATLEQIIDPTKDPNAKVRLLSGRTNANQCPSCGQTSAIATPLVYHDPEKQLLITYVPVELNLAKDRQEKIIGDLIRETTTNLPKEGSKGYLFQPRQALTLQGLIDQVMEADGVTPEMMEQQRATMRLVEQFVQADEEQLIALVQQHEPEINAQFLQTMTLLAQRMLQEGQPNAAQAVLAIQQRIVELSSYGQELMQQNEVQEKIVQEVAQRVQSLGESATRENFRDLAISFIDQDDHLQALVGLIRPAFDYQFLQEFAEYIAKAPADQTASLEALRDRIVQLTTMIDQQTQMAVQQSAELLQAIASSQNMEEIIRENIPMIDDTFMAVLTANIQEAERTANIQISVRLKEIYNVVMSVLQENMQPELRFINELLSAPSQDAANQLLQEQGQQYGENLLEFIDAVGAALAQRGDTNMLERLAAIRETAQALLQ